MDFKKLDLNDLLATAINFIDENNYGLARRAICQAQAVENPSKLSAPADNKTQNERDVDRIIFQMAKELHEHYTFPQQPMGKCECERLPETEQGKKLDAVNLKP